MIGRNIGWALAGFSILACASTPRAGAPPAAAADAPQIATAASAPPSSTPTASSEATTVDDSHAKYTLSGSNDRSAIEPTKTIPSPPATIDVRSDASVDSAIKAVPPQIPVGRLSRDTLEAPIRDATRFEPCSIPRTTRVNISVAIYNGQAIGVDIYAKPNNRPLTFCVERIVRQTTWVKELAINRVNVTL